MRAKWFQKLFQHINYIMRIISHWRSENSKFNIFLVKYLVTTLFNQLLFLKI